MNTATSDVDIELQFHGGRYGGLEGGKDLLHGIDCCDDVRARSLEHDDQDGGFAIEIAAGVDVFDRVDDPRDVIQAHDAVLVGRSCVTDLRCGKVTPGR